MDYRGFHNSSVALDEPPAAAAASDAPSADGDDDVSQPPASPKVEELFQQIIYLDMVEVHLLAELINEKLGVKLSDAERERIARGGSGGGGASSGDDDDGGKTEAKEEQTAFDLKLTGFDATAKIKVIKEIRAITSLGLKEAKELVEGAPTTVKKQIKKEEAEELKAKLEAVGGQIEIV
jgi:large subunit ribosomal protein L7/L12